MPAARETIYTVPDIGFYIHHQGSGHLFRALAIARKLKNHRITFFGSGLINYQQLIPEHIYQVHLDQDFDPQNENENEKFPDIFHYAPIGISGLRKRNLALVQWFSVHWPCLLIVDVSVEMVYLARLCGVPSVLIKLNGERIDLPHTAAYQSCEKLIASYPKWMDDYSTPKWVQDKTLFSGGFCRFDAYEKSNLAEKPNTVCVLIGSGGTKLNAEMLKNMALSCPEKHFSVLGLDKPLGDLPVNLSFYGKLNDPFKNLCECEFVIGSGGDNVVMEMAWLQKKFICIPEERPFHEQKSKAAKLDKAGLAVVVHQPQNANWPLLFLAAKKLDTKAWQKVIDPNATEIISREIDRICISIF